MEQKIFETRIPNMINIYCSKCNNNVMANLRHDTYSNDSSWNAQSYSSEYTEEASIYKCPICGAYACVYFIRNKNICTNKKAIFNRTTMYPNKAKNNFTHLDCNTNSKLDNIYKIYNCGAYNSTIISARALLQQIVRKIGKDIIEKEDDDLLKEINRLYRHNLITNELKDVAHNIRIIGNKYAHPEEIDEIFDKDDADNIISLLENFILLLIEIPNKIKQLKLKKEDKENNVQA